MLSCVHTRLSPPLRGAPVVAAAPSRAHDYAVLCFTPASR